MFTMIKPSVIVGMDEVGRGAWAGPIVVGAVILQQPIDGLADSKQLTRLQRQRLSGQIYQQGAAYLGWASPREIDTHGLTTALRFAYERALQQIEAQIDRIIIDGAYNFLHGDERVETIVRADSSVPVVSAASIIAKVARDQYMIMLASEIPGYGFERHVGYGTKLHQAALVQFGVTSEHRLTYKPVKPYVQ